MDNHKLLNNKQNQCVAYQLTHILNDKVIFSQISFTAHSGDLILLKGINSSGKTSLMNAICTNDSFENGQIYFNFKPINLNQNFYKLLHISNHILPMKMENTIYEEFYFWSLIYGTKHFLFDSLYLFQLFELKNTPIKYLSNGQKQKVNLSRVLLTPAPIWLLDEPTSYLDYKSIKILYRLINNHRAKGGICIVATHSDIDLHANQIIML
jgi:heme exporter protein A